MRFKCTRTLYARRKDSTTTKNRISSLFGIKIIQMWTWLHWNEWCVCARVSQCCRSCSKTRRGCTRTMHLNRQLTTLKNIHTQRDRGARMHSSYIHAQHTYMQCYFKVIDLKCVFLQYFIVFRWPPPFPSNPMTNQIHPIFIEWLYFIIFWTNIYMCTACIDFVEIFNSIKCTRHQMKPLKTNISIYLYTCRIQVQQTHILFSIFMLQQ